jgi:hypothetical protein
MSSVHSVRSGRGRAAGLLLSALSLALLALPALGADQAALLGSDTPRLDPRQSLRLETHLAQAETREYRVARVEPDAAQAGQLLLNLLPDVEIVLDREASEANAAGAITWQGSAADSHSQAVLVFDGQDLAGVVHVNRHQEDPTLPGDDEHDGDAAPHGELWTDTFQIEPLGGGVVVVRRIDSDTVNSVQCGTIDVNGSGPPDARDKQSAAKDPVLEALDGMRAGPVADLPVSADAKHHVSPCITNVLVIYTPAAQAAHGNIPALAQAAVAQSNLSYGNSQVHNLKLNLVGARQVSYTESNTYTSGWATDLLRVTQPGDGHMDVVHSWRAELGADVVVLITGSLPSGLGGQANAILANAGNAFAVVHYNYATSNFVFAHEVGHLQGLRHNPEIDGNTSPFPHGHGAQRWLYNYRTVMAYDCNSNCPTVAHFSNPDVKYNGRKTGDASHRNNARVLRDTSCTVSNFTPVPLLGWKYLWGNSGNGAIHWWMVNANDHYAVGDFDGDGADELFAANPTSKYAHLMDYSGGNWSTQWGNGGNGWIHWWAIGAPDRFIAGDFLPGNGRDELLGINPQSGYAHLMVYQSGVWSTLWGNNGSGAIDWWMLGSADRFLAADLDTAAPGHELLAIGSSGYVHRMRYTGSGWTTSFTNMGSGVIQWWNLGSADRYTVGDFSSGHAGAEFQAINPNGWSHTYRAVPGGWNYLWGNGGSHWIHTWWIGAQDAFQAGNFIAGNGKDELLAISQNGGWSQLLDFNGTNWQYQWGNLGGGNVGWWMINPGDRCMAGDFASGDARDELLCIRAANGWSQLHHYSP